MARRPTPGWQQGKPPKLDSPKGANPAPMPVVIKPFQPAQPGAAQGEQINLTPLPANHPNKKLDGKTYGHL